MEWLKHHAMLVILIVVSPALLQVAAVLMQVERALIASVRYEIEEKSRGR